MKVALITHTPDPDRTVAQITLTSMMKESYSEYIENWNDETDFIHLENAVKRGHESVIEHAFFTFSIEGISRACAQQLTRHRIASYTMQSQRYVDFEVPPDDVSAYDPFIREMYVDPSFEEREADIIWETVSICFDAYKELREMGTSAENARFVLPNACKTNIIVTMNARELRHFFSLRCCERAQWEIRTVADMMLWKCKEVAPILFKGAGQRCIQLGYCPEGIEGCRRFYRRDLP